VEGYQAVTAPIARALGAVPRMAVLPATRSDFETMTAHGGHGVSAKTLGPFRATGGSPGLIATQPRGDGNQATTTTVPKPRDVSSRGAPILAD
jgi:hypothetical protein